jgi:cell fate regulator YaaT (PSP1 superfamily)
MGDDFGYRATEEELSGLEDDVMPAESSEAKASFAMGANEALYRVKMIHSFETLLVRNTSEIAIDDNAFIIVNTKYGKDMGKILGGVKRTTGYRIEDIATVDRVASKADIERDQGNEERERNAFQVCAQKISEHKLDMKLVSAHYLSDESKVLFFFTAEARVDFRELVKNLVSTFHMRIELRQIGVRDEARVLGGMGVCGRVFCCHSITDKLNAVSIKMAKDQNLSLNSMKIYGPCGRLLCCLSYEAQHYRDTRRSIPSEGTRIAYDGTTFRVNEVNALKLTIRMVGEDGRILKLPVSRYKRGDDGRWLVLPGSLEPDNAK